MKKYLLDMLGTDSGQLDPQAIMMRLFVATVIALFIYVSYMLSHDGSIYSKKFNVSLVALTMITTTVMIVIGNNLALSLGMVGALSIVRFRTAIKDSRDTVYIFWAIVIGICCGAGDYLVAGLGSSFIFFTMLFLGRIKNDNRMLLIIRTTRVNEDRVEALIFQYFNNKATLRVKNTTQDKIEFIYELSRRVLEKAESNRKKKERSLGLVDSIYALDDIEYCNIVAQNDSISS